MQITNDENNGKFCKSGRIVNNIASELQVDSQEVYETLLNATWPRSEFPLVDGHGNMGFPPADMEYTEMRISDFCKEVFHKDKTTDFNTPLHMPFPYVLSNGTMGCKNSNTKIPSHNLAEIIDATIALIKEPTLETKDLMQYIKGPDLLVGGEIINKNQLFKVYEEGSGVIEIRITPQTVNNKFWGSISDYCKWYDIKLRKCLFKKEQKIIIKYNAKLFDGKLTKLMSLKEILQKYIEYYKLVQNDLSDDALCKKLQDYKKYHEIEK